MLGPKNKLSRLYQSKLGCREQNTLQLVIHFKRIIGHAAKSLQSSPTLCDPRDSSPPGSPVPGILQARVLEWVAIAFILGSNSQNHTSELTPTELCSSFLRSLTSSELRDCGHCLEATRIKKLPLPQNRITLYHLQSEPAKWTHHPCFLTFTKLMTEQRHLW